jgi:hypothetical protein
VILFLFLSTQNLRKERQIEPHPDENETRPFAESVIKEERKEKKNELAHASDFWIAV